MDGFGLKIKAIFRFLYFIYFGNKLKCMITRIVVVLAFAIVVNVCLAIAHNVAAAETPLAAAPGTFQIERLASCEMDYSKKFMDSISVVVEHHRLPHVTNYLQLNACSRVRILSHHEVVSGAFSPLRPEVIVVENFHSMMP